MADDAPVLLAHSREESRHVFEDDERDVEGVTESDEAGALHRRVDVQNPGQHRRLIRDHADGVSPRRAKPTVRFFAKDACTS